MVNESFRRGSSAPRRTRRAYYTRRRNHRLGATSAAAGFRSASPQFMRRVKNRPALRPWPLVHAMIRAIVVVGGLAAVVYGGQYAHREALTSPALAIQSVTLHQVPSILIDPVRARVNLAYGQNLLALDVESLRLEIARLPRVRNASIRRVLPDGLVISVEARQPSVRIITDTREYVVDAEGVVLDLVDPRIRLPEVRIPGDGNLGTVPGQRLTDHATYGGRLRSALAILDWLGDGSVLSRPLGHLRVDANGVVLVSIPARLEVVVGDESRIAAKLSAVRTLLRASPPEVPSTIDARYVDMLVVRPLDVETE